MEFRRLGNAGLKLSVLSFGAWVTFQKQLDTTKALRCLEVAREYGVNFFDNAEAYANGEAETIMGTALKKLGWRRSSYVVSTKFFWGLNEGVNEENTLNRKYLMQAIDGSLKRFGLDFIDLVFCHRPDPETPIEETVRAMHDIITSGKALYWGTSEWSAAQIKEAVEVADRHHLYRPQMEQPQYNLFWRKRVEKELHRVCTGYGIGLTTWSPLASGILSGKYNEGIPPESRLALEGYEWLRDRLTQRKIECVKRLAPIAKDLGMSTAQLALAWCTLNPDVTTVITGASSEEQVHENMKALELSAKLVPEVRKQIDAICTGIES